MDKSNSQLFGVDGSAKLEADIKAIQILIDEFSERYGNSARLAINDNNGRLVVVAAADASRFRSAQS